MATPTKIRPVVPNLSFTVYGRDTDAAECPPQRVSRGSSVLGWKGARGHIRRRINPITEPCPHSRGRTTW